MDDLARGAFLTEVETQCVYALNAWAQLGKDLAEFQLVEASLSQRRFELACEVFRSIHSLLVHTGCVSRLLWPPSSKSAVQARAAEIRSLLIPAPDGAVLAQRDLRNHLEHYDERLDAWAASASTRDYVHDVIAPFEPILGAVDRDILRWYDPVTRVFRFQGEAFELSAFVTALEDLFSAASSALKHRDPDREDYGPRPAV